MAAIEHTSQQLSQNAAKEAEFTPVLPFEVVPTATEIATEPVQVSNNKTVQIAVNVEFGNATQVTLKPQSLLVKGDPGEWGENTSLEDDGSSFVVKRRPISLVPGELGAVSGWFFLPEMTVRGKHGFRFLYQFDQVNASSKLGIRIYGGF